MPHPAASPRTARGPLSPSRLELWDTCPAAYRWSYVEQLPEPEADARQRLVGQAVHALLEAYVQHLVAAGAEQDPAHLAPAARALYRRQAVAGAGAATWREALGLVEPFARRYRLLVRAVAGVERRVALSADGALADWRDVGALVRGVIDLLLVEDGTATVVDWKSGWVEEPDMARAWAPTLYGAAVWALGPGLERVEVEYRYLRTGRARRIEIPRELAAEALDWARAARAAIDAALDAPDQDRAWPPRPGSHCATCPWALRCPAAKDLGAAAELGAVSTEAEARELAGRLLAAEARAARLRGLLQAYLRDRDPLVVSEDLAIGWWPTRGSLPPRQTVAILEDAGLDPWEALRVDNTALARLTRRRPDVEARLELLREPGPPWWGHRRPKAEDRG